MRFKKLTTIFVLFVGSLIENVLFFRLLFTNSISFLIFIIIHSLIMGGIYIYLEKFQNKNVNIPIYIGFFIPSIGIIILLAIYISLILTKKKSNIIEDYNKYIEYIDEIISVNKVSFDKELNVVTALDSLKLSTDKKKKNMIIDLISDDIDIKINILRTALKDKDPEVVHYASSILNLVEEEYEKSINNIRDKYVSTKSEVTLKELINLYYDYLNSGIISERLLEFELDEYLITIDEYTDNFGFDYSILLKKIDVLIKIDRNEEALNLMELIGDNKGTNELYFYKLKALYNINANNEVIRLANKIKEMDIDIPEDYKGIVEFWT